MSICNPCRVLVCVFAIAVAATSAHAVPLTTPLSPEAALAARCKAASFRLRPPGQMATTMRELQIQRCIKNGGTFLD